MKKPVIPPSYIKDRRVDIDKRRTYLREYMRRVRAAKAKKGRAKK